MEFELVNSLYYGNDYSLRKLSKLFNCSRYDIKKVLRENKNFKVKPNGHCKQIKLNNIPSEIAYFSGLVVGDGSLYHSPPSSSYRISMASTKMELLDLFRDSARKIGLHPSRVYRVKLNENRFSGEYRAKNNIRYSINCYSKECYNLLRESKGKDFEWFIPKFINSKEELKCFIGGLFDAEGCPGSEFEGKIEIGSKSPNSLERLRKSLEILGYPKEGIHIYKFRPSLSVLGMFKYRSVEKFFNEMDIRLERKKLVLQKYLLNHRSSKHRVIFDKKKFMKKLVSDSIFIGTSEKRSKLLPEVLKLYSTGLSQCEIAEKLNIGHSTVSDWLRCMIVAGCTKR